MHIIWDAAKERLLRKERGIEISEVAGLIEAGLYLAILENPIRPLQDIFIVRYQGYVHVVPFVVDGDGRIVLKTVFPSRKYHKRYGGSDES
jgi:hypothetical protein